jgi:hypothetical protein
MNAGEPGEARGVTSNQDKERQMRQNGTEAERPPQRDGLVCTICHLPSCSQ